MNLCQKCLQSHDKKHRIIECKELDNYSYQMIEILKKYFYYKYNVIDNKKVKSDKSDKSEGFKPKSEKQQKTESDFGLIGELKDLIFTIASDSKICRSYIHYENIRYLNCYFDEKLELEYYSYDNESELNMRLFGEQFVKKIKINAVY